jgi:hypothetical protein
MMAASRADDAVRGALRRCGTALLAGAAAGLVATALLLAGARWLSPSTISGPVAEGGWTARSRACFVPQGFYSAESDADAGRHFSWTGPTARLTFPNLNRSQPYRLTLLVRGGRPPDVAPPALLRLTVDGVVGAVVERPPNERIEVAVDVPPRALHGAVVTIDVSDTFVPGAHDRRALGMIVDDVSLASRAGPFRPTWSVAARAGLAAALCAAGLLLCGVRGPWAPVGAALLSTGLVTLLLLDGAFIGSYVDRLVSLGAGIAICGALVAVVGWGGRAAASALPEWPVAVGLVLGVSAWKLAVFAHPIATVGDAIFQVHRAQLVHAGQYFFTSVTPRPFFEFPYPVALFVAAQPFWQFFSGSKLELALLLRGLALAADALVGFALYAVARRQWGDGRTALLCAALWPFAAGPLQAVSNANLTNVFGQGLFGVAMGGVAWIAAGGASAAAVVVAGAALTSAFLSHFSTVTTGLCVLGAVGIALFAAGRNHAKQASVWVLVLSLAAAAVSYLAYYSRFTSVYRATLERVVSSQEEAAPSKLVASPSVKLRRWLDGTGDDYGRPGLVLLVTAAAGAVLLLRRRPREGLTLVLIAWGLVWVAFTALGILTPLSMRANLASAPVFLGLSAYALGHLSARSRPGAAGAAALAIVIAWDGVRVALQSLGATCLACPWILGLPPG